MKSLPATMVVLGAGAAAVYGISRLAGRKNRVLALSTAAVLVGAMAAEALSPSLSAAPGIDSMGPTTESWVRDFGSQLLAMIALGLGLLVTIFSGQYLSLDRRYEDFYPLLLLQVCGAIGMVTASDLFVLYLCSVFCSASSYVLVAFRRHTDTAVEAGYKYAVLGGMGSITMLAGLGFIFRASGTLALPLATRPPGLWGGIGSALLLGGLGIKAALFPAHVWLPDAHGRAPSSVSAILSGIVVPSYLFALAKTGLALRLDTSHLGAILIAFGVATMIVGNSLALKQTYGKRLLGYSSVAHLGYISCAFGAGMLSESPGPMAAGLLVLVFHALDKGLAFLCKGAFHYYCDATLVTELEGIWTRMPVASAAFIVSLASLAGFPPMGGFVAKFWLLESLASIGWLGAVLMAVIAANSLLSLGYYLPLLGHLLPGRGKPLLPVTETGWIRLPLVAMAGLSIVGGLASGPLLRLAERAGQALLSWGVP